jgi:DeoR family transcriptional regulator of aga operon
MESSERRRARIVELVRSHDFVRVADLGEMFGVSPVTVRGDLDVLAARGEVRRIRGGAISHEAPVLSADEDEGIGRAAAMLLAGGECACVAAGAVGLARALAERRMRGVVVTNGLDVAAALSAGSCEVVVTGGTLAGSVLVDPLGELVLTRVNADVAFVACAALAAPGGATDRDLRVAAAARRMLERASRRVLLVPGAGVGDVRTGVVCPIDDVDVLVTGASADAGALEAVREQGIEVVVA